MIGGSPSSDSSLDSDFVFVDDCVRAQVGRTPDASAVATEETVWSYRELDARATELAAALRGHGVGREVVVALLLRRSPSWLTAMLGVLAAGGVYLPLDPEMSDERLAQLLRLGGVHVLVTDAASVRPLPDWRGPVVYLDITRPPKRHARPARPPEASPDDLAYLMPTSGTTGEPKLVEVPHRGVVNLVRYATQSLLEPAELAVVPFLAALWFDSSVSQALNVLATGGLLVLCDGIQAALRSSYFRRFTTIGATPSVMATLLAAGTLPPAARLVALGAEVIPEGLLAQIQNARQVRRVINYYGPTETTIYCTTAIVFDRDRVPQRLPSGGRAIGRPITGVRAWVLDDVQQPVAPGGIGWLFIAGPGVARGYRGRPDLTTAAFGPAPDGDRMYATGDRVRLCDDRSLEFHGRADRQIKLNGVRLQLEEIEAALARHPSVRWAWARVVESRSGHTRLICYFAASAVADADGGARELRAFLRRQLPAVAVPAELVCVTDIPLTSNGKLDVARLPNPSRPPRPRAAAPVGVAALVADVYCRLLELDEVPLDEDLIDLGADSMQMVRIALELERRTGRAVPLELLREGGAVDAVARWLDTASVPARPIPEPNLLAETLVAMDGTADACFDASDAKGWALALEALTARPRAPALGRIAGRLARRFPELRFARFVRAAVDGAARRAAGVAEFVDDPTRDVQFVPGNAAATTLLLLFCGDHHRLGMPLELMHRWLWPLGAHLVYLKDFSQRYFLNGVASLGPSASATTAGLRALAARLGVRRIACYGNSSGVYAALRYGLDLEAAAVVGMAGPTNLDPEFLAAHESQRALLAIARQCPDRAVDLRRLFAAAPRRPRVRLIYGAARAVDRLQAENLSGLDGVRLEPLAGYREHNVVQALLWRGRLGAVLDELVGPVQASTTS